MAHLQYKVIFILTILFLSVDAKPNKHKHGLFKARIKVPRRPAFFDFKPKPLGDDDDNNNNNNKKDFLPTLKDAVDAVEPKGDFEMVSIGHWEIISQNAGVSAMHVNLLPTNKIIIYDTKIYRTSRIKLPDGVPCLPYEDLRTKENKLDCFAHSVEYDIETNQIRPLRVCIKYQLPFHSTYVRT